MSTLFVKVVKINDIVPHGKEGVHSLEVAKIAGWECVVKKGQFAKGDLAVYVPVDSRIPYSLEERIFKNAKVKLDHGRIKTIKLQGRVSQGLLIKPSDVPEIGEAYEGKDVAEALQVTKYEPPEPGTGGFGPKSGKQRKQTPGFIKYTDIENIKWYNDAFKEGDLVVMTEKLHGTSSRFTLAPKEARTLWEKTKKFFGVDLGLELVCGTRETEHNEEDKHSTWAEVGRNYAISKRLQPGEIVFGEIVGKGIQKGYNYGFDDEYALYVYDVSVSTEDGGKRFLNHDELWIWCKSRGFDMVPVLYVGPYSEQILKTLTGGPSVLHPATEVREGTVVRPFIEEKGPSSNRKVLKSINPEYDLKKKKTEFH